MATLPQAGEQFSKNPPSKRQADEPVAPVNSIDIQIDAFIASGQGG